MTKPTPIEPEVVSRTALAAAVQTHLDRALHLHNRVVESANNFAISTVLCGLELLALKASVGHGNWQEFHTAHLAERGLGLRHIQRYMETATAFKRKVSKLRGEKRHVMSFLPATIGDNGTYDVTPEAIEAVKSVLAEMTDATTWQQLWLDFGLMRRPKPLGGARPHGDPLDKAELYARELARMTTELLHVTVKQKCHAYLSQAQLKTLHGDLVDITRAVKEMIQ